MGRFNAFIGLTAGFAYAVQSSVNRLTGLEANDSEVARYGAISTEQLQRIAPKLTQANANLIDSKLGEFEKH
jgi:hypothetical protein